MNTVSLAGYNTLEDPSGDTPYSTFFCLHSGASRWGYGRTLMLRSVYNQMMVDLTSNWTKSAVVTTLYLADDERNVSLNVLVLGATPLSTAVGLDNAPNDNDVMSVWLSDPRRQITFIINQSFNVQQQNFPYYPGTSTPILYPETMNSGSDWTWLTMITGALKFPPISTPLAPTTYEPRNLIFDNIPNQFAADELASQLYLILGYNNALDAYNPNFEWGRDISSTCTWWGPGGGAKENDDLYEQATKQALIGGKSTVRSFASFPQSIQVSFKVGYNYDAPTDPYASRFYLPASSTNTIGNPSVNFTIENGNHIATWQSGTAINSAELDAVAVDIAQRYVNFNTEGLTGQGTLKSASTTSLVMQTLEFRGPWGFTQTDGKFRGVMWVSDKSGCRTFLRCNNSEDFSTADEMKRNWSVLSNQLTEGLGWTNTSISTGGTRYVWTPNINPVSCLYLWFAICAVPSGDSAQWIVNNSPSLLICSTDADYIIPPSAPSPGNYGQWSYGPEGPPPFQYAWMWVQSSDACPCSSNTPSPPAAPTGPCTGYSNCWTLWQSQCVPVSGGNFWDYQGTGNPTCVGSQNTPPSGVNINQWFLTNPTTAQCWTATSDASCTCVDGVSSSTFNGPTSINFPCGCCSTSNPCPTISGILPGVAYSVQVSQTGGADGGFATYPTWTYSTGVLPDGSAALSGVSPTANSSSGGRSQVSTIPGNYGLVVLDCQAKTWTLFWVNESVNFGPCNTAS